MAASHYETLGVADGADAESVRRAYLDLARRLHPDRWSDATGEERDTAERRMREVNEAWRVLGNPGRRLAYDASRRRARVTTGGAGFSTGDLFVDEDAPPDTVARVIRFLPWAVVLVALAAIFVFTAYATSDAPTTSCIRRDGDTAVSVTCDDPAGRPVRFRVADVTQCPESTEPFQPAGSQQALCLGT